MPLGFSQPPRKCWQVAADTLANQREQLDALFDDRSALPATLELGAAHELYVLDDANLDALRPRRAQKSGWRFIILCADEPVAAIEVNQKGRDFDVACLAVSSSVTDFVRAVVAAESLRALRREAYKASLLRVPARYATALWLRSRREDRFLPIPPTFERYAPYALLDTKSFCAALASPEPSTERA